MQPEPTADPPGPRPAGRGPAPPQLSVAAAARRLGIAPATLRTWDRRYGIGPSGHVPGRHRRYSPDDVARLELMQHALVRGAGPAEAAAYALAARPGSFPPDLGDPGPAVADGIGADGSRVRVGGQVLRLPGAGRRARGLGRAALALDAALARTVLADSIAAAGIEATWNDVAVPVLTAVGERWAATGVGVEIEHLLSECISSVLGAHTVAIANSGARPVLLAGMPGELHTLPMAVLAATLAGSGVLSRSLGSDLPVDALVAAIRRTAPVAVVLWSQLPCTADPDVARALPRTRPGARTFVAGPGWAETDLPARVARLGSLAEATRAIADAAAV